MLKVATLDRRGYDQWSIARELGVSRSLVQADLKKIRKQYIEARTEVQDQTVQLIVAQYREVMEESWRAWERSKTDAMRDVTEETLFDEVSRTKITRYVEGRLPGAQYLQTILQCLKAIRDLFDLDLKKGPDTQVNVMTIDWESLKGRPPSTQVDKLEARIAEVELLGQPSEPIKSELQNGTSRNGEMH